MDPSRSSAAPVFNTANGIDYSLIALYFVIIIAVGIVAARQNKNTDEFFKGGGRIPWLVAGLSNWVSGFSAFMFVAAAGFTYTNGAGALVIFTSGTWAYLLGYFFFSWRWRRVRIRSPLEFLSRRFSPATTYFYSITTVIPQIVGIGQGLYILCIFVSTALGFAGRSFSWGGIELTGFELSLLITGTVMVLYTVIGGLWAAVLSDAVQSVIIVTMTLIIFPVSFAYLGQGEGIGAGLARLVSEAPEGYLGLRGQLANPFFLGAYVLNALLGYNVNWALVQRYQSVPDERGARKMALLCAGLAFIGPVLWILPVMASKIIFPDMNVLWPSFAVPSEASFVSLALFLLPHGMIGFVISAILSATLGQANDAFNWLTATLTRDIYVPWRKRLGKATPSDRRQLIFARGVMFTVGMLGILVAFNISRLGGAFAFALEYHSLMAAFLMPVALGMLYTRTPWWSGIASCSSAILVALLLMSTGLWKEQSFVRNMVSESIVAAAVFFGSAFFYRDSDPRHAALRQLRDDLHRPVADAETRGDTSGFGVYRMLGWICVVIGVVLSLLVGVPATATAPATINLVAGLLLLVLGGVLIYFSRNTAAGMRGNMRAVPADSTDERNIHAR